MLMGEGDEIPLTPQGQDHAPVPVDPLDLHGTIPVRDRPAVAQDDLYLWEGCPPVADVNPYPEDGTILPHRVRILAPRCRAQGD